MLLEWPEQSETPLGSAVTCTALLASPTFGVLTFRNRNIVVSVFVFQFLVDKPL